MGNLTDDEKSRQSFTRTVSELKETILTLYENVQRLLKKEVSTSTVTSKDVEIPTRTNPAGVVDMPPSELPPKNSLLASEGATKFGYSAEFSIPFVETVHSTLKKQITEGKDAYLASLLIPINSAQNSEQSTTLYNSKEFHDPHLNNSLSLAQFIQAFAIYMYKNIMCKAYSMRRLESDLYEKGIIDMATRYSRKGF